MRSDRIRARAALASVLIIVAFGSAACTQASGTASEAPKPVVSAQPQAAVTATVDTTPAVVETTVAAPAPKPKMTAKQVATKRCKGCHSVSKALGYRTSKAGSAKAMVRSMERRGASLSADEKSIIIDYYLR